jgi:hypothetical protein
MTLFSYLLCLDLERNFQGLLSVDHLGRKTSQTIKSPISTVYQPPSVTGLRVGG